MATPDHAGPRAGSVLRGSTQPCCVQHGDVLTKFRGLATHRVLGRDLVGVVITHGVVAGHTVALVLGDVGEVGGVGDDTALLVDYFLMNSPADAKSCFYLLLKD